MSTIDRAVPTAPTADLPERMAETADMWFAEAAEKEGQANELRREELRLRVEIVGLRAAAQGMRAAMRERLEYAEKMQSIVNQEQEQDAAEDVPLSASKTRSYH